MRDAVNFPSPLVGEGQGERDSLLQKAKRLRTCMTDAEQLLWRQLRGKRFDGYKFRRQVPIGRYIADFICYHPKLIVELDGGQHAIQTDYDRERDRFFKNQGFKVIRFWNNDAIPNQEGVLMAIMEELKNMSGVPLTPTLSHKGRGSMAIKEMK